MRVGLDIDGVFADFNTAYRERVLAVTGVALPAITDTYPDVWSYDKAAGLTDAQIATVWADIMKSHNYWLKLGLMPGADSLLKRLAEVQTMHELYFITARPGRTSKFQTEAWLLKWFNLPTIIVTQSRPGAKGEVAKGLGLEVFVDDKPENVNEVIEALDGNALVLMPDRSWNRNAVLDARVGRVKHLEKVLSIPLGFWEVAA